MTAKDDFIWNKDFVPRMKRLLDDDDDADSISSDFKVLYYPFICIYMCC